MDGITKYLEGWRAAEKHHGLTPASEITVARAFENERYSDERTELEGKMRRVEENHRNEMLKIERIYAER